MDKEQKAHDLALAYELLIDINPDCDISPEGFIANYEKAYYEFSKLLQNN